MFASSMTICYLSLTAIREERSLYTQLLSKGIRGDLILCINRQTSMSDPLWNLSQNILR